MSEFDPRRLDGGADEAREPGPGTEHGAQSPQGGRPGSGYPGAQPGTYPADPYATGAFQAGAGQTGAYPPGADQTAYQAGAGQAGAYRPGAHQPGVGYPGGGFAAGADRTQAYATGEFRAEGGYPGGAQHGWGTPTGQWARPGYGGYQPPFQAPRPPQTSRRRVLKSAGIAAGVIGLSVVVGLGIGRLVWVPGSSDNAGGNQDFGSVAPPGGTNSTSVDPQAIAAKVNPGLVDVNTELGYQGAAAAGTGIVLTADGEILTNNHVVEGATKIKVTDIGDGKTYDASVVGYDRSHDIAVLQLANASGLKTETLGNSSSVSVGDAVVGIGNAGGVGGTPSVAPGTVTALDQAITASDESSSSSEQLTGLIQVNANIQSGDSGGSLVNSQGQVIGVDTAASAGYQFSGGGRRGDGGQGNDQGGQGGQGGNHQGFAIPINQAISLAHQIVAKQASDTVHIGASAFLGVSVTDAGQQGQQGGQGQGGFGQDPNGQGQAQGNGSGAQIQQLVPNGAAQQAGLQAGDVITSVDGKNVDSATTLTNLMDTHHPGDKLTVTVQDQSGQQKNVTVVPAAGPVG